MDLPDGFAAKKLCLLWGPMLGGAGRGVEGGPGTFVDDEDVFYEAKNKDVCMSVFVEENSLLDMPYIEFFLQVLIKKSNIKLNR